MGYTQVYSVAQAACQSTDNSEYGPGCLGSGCSGAGGLGTLGGSAPASGTAFGEVASVANGLTAAPITKVVVTQLHAEAQAFNFASSQSCPTSGVFGVQIVNSAGAVQYTFSSTFDANANRGTWAAMCTVVPSSTQSTWNGWSNVPFVDDSNTYTMVAGDAILITWSGTGNNVAAVSQSIAGTYGKSAYLSGTTLTTVAGRDAAFTAYTGFAPPPTTFYLHAATSTDTGTFPNTAGALLGGGGNAGAINPSRPGADSPSLNRSMDTTIGTSEASISITSLANTSKENYYFGKFLSAPLPTGQTISAATWTFNHALAESNTNAAMNTAGLYLYVWRPSTGAFVGWICNGAGAAGYALLSAANTEKLELTTWTGSAVTCQAGDVLIAEIWAYLTQTSSNAYTDTFYFDGTTATSSGTSGSTTVSSMASYISADAGITLNQLWTPTLATETVTVSDPLVKHKRKPRSLTTDAVGSVTDAAKKKALHKQAEPIRSPIVIQA